MSLRKMVGMERGLQDLQFEIKPKSVVFEGKVVSRFALYLQKGVQVVGSFDSGTKHHPKETLFKFKNIEGASFRLKSLSNATYTWCFYEHVPVDDSEEFQDTVSVDLMRSIELYGMELMDKEREIQTSVRERNPSQKTILKIWQKIKREMRTSRSLLTCIFPKLSVHLEFQLQIKNSLDLELLRQNDRLPLRKSMSQPEIKFKESTLKTNIAQPLTITDQKISGNENSGKKNHMKLQKKRSPLRQFLKNDVDPSLRKDNDEIYAVVNVVNPSGQTIDHEINEGSFDKISKRDSIVPSAKKFSMLSDIIERSYEGSSSYGPDKISCSDRYPSKKDEIVDTLDMSDGFARRGNQIHTNQVSVDSPLLNKFKTLPHDNYDLKYYPHQERSDLRRAQTTEKDPKFTIQENQYSSVDENEVKQKYSCSTKQSSNIQRRLPSSGDPFAKYIFFGAILIVLIIFWSQLPFKRQKKVRGKEKIRPQKIKIQDF